MHDSLWFSTRSVLFREGDSAWNEVARYAMPLTRLLARRYPWLEADARQDLVHDVLIEIKEKLTDTYDPQRGRFRALLQAVLHRRVVDWVRHRQPVPLGDVAPAAPRASEVDAMDLEAAILDAIAACHDHFSQGPHRDLDVVWTLGDRLVRGLKNVEIARDAGLTVRQVAHRLGRARQVIFSHLLARELGLPLESPALDPAVEVFRRCLRKPREATRLLEELGEGSTHERLEGLLERFWASLDLLGGDDSAQGVELARGIRAIFQESQEEGAAA